MAKLPLRRRAQGFQSQCLVFIASVCLATGAAGSLSARIGRGEQNPPVPLTAISEIRGLAPEIAQQRQRVLVRGTVTYINEREPAGLIVHDGSAGLFVRLRPPVLCQQSAPRPAPRRRGRRRRLHVGRWIRSRRRSRIRPPGGPLRPSPGETRALCVAAQRRLRLRVHRGGGRRPAGLAVRVRQNPLRRYRGRWRCGARLVLGFLSAGSDPIHRRPRQAPWQRWHAVQPDATGARDFALRGAHRRRRARHAAAGSVVASGARDLPACTPIRRRIRSTAGCGCAGR